MGAINIIRKVASFEETSKACDDRKKVPTQLKNVSLAKVDRGVLSRSHRYDIFNNMKKSYRIKCEEMRFQAVS